MDKELIENIANAFATSEICPFAHEDCIDNCHKHFSNWLDNHDKQIRADAIDEVSRAMYHQCFECDNDEDMQKWDSGNWIRYKLFENVIEQLKEQK